jgi:hypothetical protein
MDAAGGNVDAGGHGVDVERGRGDGGCIDAGAGGSGAGLGKALEEAARRVPRGVVALLDPLQADAIGTPAGWRAGGGTRPLQALERVGGAEVVDQSCAHGVDSPWDAVRKKGARMRPADDGRSHDMEQMFYCQGGLCCFKVGLRHGTPCPYERGRGTAYSAQSSGGGMPIMT